MSDWVLSNIEVAKEPKLCIKRRQAKLASDIKDEINISCYTEYKAFGPSLIYNSNLALPIQS